jgi:Ser/Thr protein kinase RdoA (MazF antagonist)
MIHSARGGSQVGSGPSPAQLFPAGGSDVDGLTNQYKVAVAAAVRTFHELDLVHCDLRASNVFVKSEKSGDVGLPVHGF